MGSADIFKEFLQRHGAVIHADLQLLVPLMGDRGVIAAKNICAGQQLMLIPTSICPHMPGDQEWSCQEPHHFSPAVLYLKQSCPQLSPFLATVLLMLHEQAQGRNSELWPFLETLPADHDCLLAWSQEEAAELKGTSIEREGSPAQSVFQREALPAMQAQPALWPPSVQGYAAFERMAGLVQSRTFHMLRQNWVTGAASEGAELHMLPGIDLINHSCMPAMRNTELNRVDVPLTVKSHVGKEVVVPSYFTMTAARDIGRGEQLLHSYGNLSDAETLETYGFVENLPEGHRNPHNSVKVPLDLVIRTSEAAQVGEDAVEKLMRSWPDGDAPEYFVAELTPAVKQLVRGITGCTPVVALQITHQQPLSEALAETVQLLQETAEGLQGMEHENGDSDEHVYHHLLSIADAMLARLPTTAEEDKLGLENVSGMPPRLAMAYKVRMGERDLIQGLRRATIMLMMGQQQQQDDEASQGDEIDDSGSDTSEASSEEEAAGSAAKRRRH